MNNRLIENQDLLKKAKNVVETTEETKNSAKSTGQIISEGHFGVLIFSIKQQNCLNDFFPSL